VALPIRGKEEEFNFFFHFYIHNATFCRSLMTKSKNFL